MYNDLSVKASNIGYLGYWFISDYSASNITLFKSWSVNNVLEHSLPVFILNFRTFGCLLEINFNGWSVECLCRSVAEINYQWNWNAMYVRSISKWQWINWKI